MPFQTIDRITSLRPSSAGPVADSGLRVIPVAAVNPVSSHSSPSVIVQIDTGNHLKKPGSGEAVYTSVSDPGRRGSEAATAEKDWTVRRPEADKVEEPPPEPISKMMLEFLQTMWRASGSAIEAALARQENTSANPDAQPGKLAKEELTYSPAKIRKAAHR